MQDWTDKADWMRATGVTRAAWSPDDKLLTCELGQAPSGTATETQRSQDPKAEATRARAEYQRVVTAASSGLVPRVVA